jgi:sec-independent protein translocase protein TatC
MWILFELGLIFSRYYTKPKDESAEENSIGGETVAAAASASAATGAKAASRVEPSFSESYDTGPADDTPAEDYGKADEEDANDSGHGEYEPLSEAEMDAELDQLEEDEEEDEPNSADAAQDGNPPRPRDDA